MALTRYVALALCLVFAQSLTVTAETSPLQQLAAAGHSGFVQLLEQADLVKYVEGELKAAEGSTIFAPTDDTLMYKISPTFLAFLKMPENVETLRSVLLFHIVPERISAFRWEGAHRTLEGSDVDLSMDALAFYAERVPIDQYNSLVADNTVVHTVQGLLLPPGVVSSEATSALVNENSIVETESARRRFLAEAPGPATAPVPAPAPEPVPAPVVSIPPTSPPVPSPPPPPPKSVGRSGLSLLAMIASALAGLAALL